MHHWHHWILPFPKARTLRSFCPRPAFGSKNVWLPQLIKHFLPVPQAHNKELGCCCRLTPKITTVEFHNSKRIPLSNFQNNVDQQFQHPPNGR
jgi:hypothetical protein